MPQEGDYVCVRSDQQGVVWGTLVWRVGRECRIKNARQQYQWQSGAMTLFDLVSTDPAKTGLKLSHEVEEIDMTEVCGVILVPKSMVQHFKSHPAA
jgi:hypothetical protein